MKKLLTALILGLTFLLAHAEASFEQIEVLIQQKNYSAAAQGLEVIISNHPKSSKAFYAMAQAQAGLGNLEKARKALDIATGLNPTLSFAPSSSVENLKQAITPQTSKIESIEETHYLRNFVILVLLLGGGYAVFYGYSLKQKSEKERRRKEDEFARKEKERLDNLTKMLDAERDRLAKERKLNEAAHEAATKKHANKTKTEPSPVVSPQNTVQSTAAPKPLASNQPDLAVNERLRQQQETERLSTYSSTNHSAPTPHTTVVNNNSSSDMLTGILIGNMLSGSHNTNHTSERTVTREVVREVTIQPPTVTETPTKDSSWEDSSTSGTKDSSWEDSSSTTTKSSSWDDSSSSSSSSSSSWESSSSSSDSSSSSSSSSWD